MCILKFEFLRVGEPGVHKNKNHQHIIKYIDGLL